MLNVIKTFWIMGWGLVSWGLVLLGILIVLDWFFVSIGFIPKLLPDLWDNILNHRFLDYEWKNPTVETKLVDLE